jgi:hypothetical protein
VKDLQAAKLDRLHGWLLGLPWVVERPGIAEAPQLRWFGLNCPPLHIRRLWLFTGSLGDFPTDELGVLVVVPTGAARPLVEAGDGTLVAAVGDQDSLVLLGFDTMDQVDDVRLERTLFVAYDACLAEPRWGCDQPRR